MMLSTGGISVDLNSGKFSSGIIESVAHYWRHMQTLNLSDNKLTAKGAS